MPSHDSKMPVGTVLVGKYRVAREIGRGGMAAVYEAEQLSLGKKVAVKVLAAELSASTIVIERFFREARAAASISSPHIVDIYDSGRLDDGRPFIAMELLVGESLYDRMARVRVIDPETTIRVIIHTAKGLMKAHAAGIVHRDLKPENIFLTKGEDGEDLCKILDFGLAKFYAPVNPEEKAQKRLTREGAVFGTPAYMSPEQVKGQGNVDHRADLWALGCMAYECLIGRPVWNMDQGVAMTFASIATGPIPVPSQVRPDLPPAFDAWFKRCLDRDPNRRYQSAKELADALIEAWGGRTRSSASFPNVVLSGAARQVAGIGGGAQELSPDILESVRPPASVRPRPPEDLNPFTVGGPRPQGSDDSVPLPLMQRPSTDVPPTTGSDISPMSARGRVSVARVVMSATLLAASVSAAAFVWLRYLNPQVFTPIIQSTATAAPITLPSATNGTTTNPPPEEPKWVAPLGEGQRLFSEGKYGDAQKKFQEVISTGGIGATIGKTFLEQTKFVEKATGPCKAASFARPRGIIDRRAERPAIVATPKGALVVWGDDHEQKDRDHLYGILVGEAGRTSGPIRDLTPEAGDAQRPQLFPQNADRNVLLYWDGKQRDAGVRVRLLDAEGRIDGTKGQSVLVGAARPGAYWPSMERGPDGGYFVVWQDDRDKDNDTDLFMRRLSADLDTVGPEMRLTDYVAPPKSKASPPRVRYPSVAVAANTLIVTYRLERDRDRSVKRMRIPLHDLEKGALEESKDASRASRELGSDVISVSDDKTAADAPAIACGAEGCFVAWHVEPSSAFAAMIDPKEGKVIWRKRLGDKGGHPSLAVNGQVAVAYYDAGKIKLAFLSRDGVSDPHSSVLRIFEPQMPRPYLAAGADKNEWFLAWQDQENRTTAAEVFAARVVCR